jgi:hypothetical protein
VVGAGVDGWAKVGVGVCVGSGGGLCACERTRVVVGVCACARVWVGSLRVHWEGLSQGRRLGQNLTCSSLLAVVFLCVFTEN